MCDIRVDQVCTLIPWGPLPGGQGGRPPPPPDFEGKFFNTFRPPPDFGGFCSEMF